MYALMEVRKMELPLFAIMGNMTEGEYISAQERFVLSQKKRRKDSSRKTRSHCKYHGFIIVTPVVPASALTASAKPFLRLSKGVGVLDSMLRHWTARNIITCFFPLVSVSISWFSQYYVSLCRYPLLQPCTLHIRSRHPTCASYS